MKKFDTFFKRILFGMGLAGLGFMGLKFSGVLDRVDYVNQPALAQMKEQFSDDIQKLEVSVSSAMDSSLPTLSTNFLALARQSSAEGVDALEIIYPQTSIKLSSYIIQNRVGTAKVYLGKKKYDSLVYSFTKETTNYWAFFRDIRM